MKDADFQKQKLIDSCQNWIEQLQSLSSDFNSGSGTEQTLWQQLAETAQPHVRMLLNGITLEFPEDLRLQELGATLICTAVRMNEFAFPQQERIAWMEGLQQHCDQFADRDLAGKLLGNYGNALASAGQLREAEPVLRNRLRMAIEDGDSTGEDLANEHLGKLMLRQGRFNDGYAILETLYEKSREQQNHSATIRLLKDVADAAFRRDEHDLGIQRMRERIKLAKEANDTLILFSTYHVLAERLCEINRLDEADDYIQQAMDLGSHITTPYRKASLLGTRGNIALERGDIEAAHDYFLKTRRIFKKLNCIAELGMTASSLGETSWKKGNHSQAIRWLNEAMDIDRNTGRQDDLAIDLGTLGKVLVETGDLSGAIEAYAERYDILTEIGEEERAATTLNELNQMKSHLD